MYLTKYIGKVSLVTGFASLTFFATNIVLARKLEVEDFGHFSLIRSLVMLIPVLIFLGFSNSIIRFSKFNVISQYNIFKPIKKVSIFSVIFAVFIIGFVKYLYSLDMLDSLVLLGSSWILGRLWISNSLLRINEQYLTAQLLPFAWKFILLFLIIVLVLFDKVSLISALVVLFFSFIVSYFYGIRKEKQFKCGTKELSVKKIYLTGLSFFFVNLLSLFMSQFDKLSIAKLFSNESVAIYTGVSLIALTSFNLLGTSVGYVLMPHLSKNKIISKTEFILYVFIVPIILYLLFFNFGEIFNDLFYKNKYSNYPVIFQLTLVIAVLQYYNNLIQFSIGGIGSNKHVIQYLFLIIISSVIIVFTYILLKNTTLIGENRLVGLIISILIGWMFRVFFGGGLLIGKLLKARK
ncbi:MAG: oligosaccharide flippase family protein [Candidatus Marinimicrobia bacterium]|nr:oligosaccharide flippase family protein [Candidatus Neomarinimicrobiota bacterium]MBL7023123.1 oligosaccharide flippase family protein [Candidatus Neomarinimicrobiota bacterium]